MSPRRIQLALTIADDRIAADFAGTSPQVRRPVNSPMNYTRAYVAVPLKMICDPELPNNEGTYRPLEIRAPAGTLDQSDLSRGLLLATGLGTCWFPSWSSASWPRSRRSECRPTPARCRPGSSTSTALRRNGEAWALHQHAFGGMGGRPGRGWPRLP